MESVTLLWCRIARATAFVEGVFRGGGGEVGGEILSSSWLKSPEKFSAHTSPPRDD